MGHVNRGGWIALAGALLACLLIGATAAHAAFTSSVRAGTLAVSTIQLATPTGFAVDAFCIPSGKSGKSNVSVTVTGSGTAPRATDYVLTVADETGVRYTSDLKSGATTTYAPTSGPPSAKWSYIIRSEFRVQATGIIWKSNSPAKIIC